MAWHFHFFFILELPEQVWLKILGFLEHQDLIAVIELGKQVND